MRKIENKYAHNPTEAFVDVALQAMRARHLEDVKARKKDISKNKKIEIYHKWYGVQAYEFILFNFLYKEHFLVLTNLVSLVIDTRSIVFVYGIVLAVWEFFFKL